MNVDVVELKKQAGERAAEFVESGMVVGLGHGSTAVFAIRRIAQMLRDGQLKDILAVPCSKHVEEDAKKLGIPLTTLNEHLVIDLTIDGADEVDSKLNLIKGGGGALLREKVVAQASHREIIVVDESKLSPALGTNHSVPVEIVPFAWMAHVNFLQLIGARTTIRRNAEGSFFQTDQGNMIIDCDFGPIKDPSQLSAFIKSHAGIVEHGLFLGIATDVIVAGQGGIQHLKSE